MGQRTPLHDRHVDAGGRMVDFAGWDMPIQYRSQLEEHRAVRADSGAFDVSHMAVVDIEGEGAEAFLRHLLANDVGRLESDGRALYTCMLNGNGGVLDDLIVYRLAPTRWRTVVNAATREKDLAWMGDVAAGFAVDLAYRDDLALIAIQGPRARERTLPLLPEALRERAGALRPFNAVVGGEWFVSRTGYTGEDGFEVALPASEVVTFWDGLMTAGVPPCGLGARDTLRLEAGLNLYGQDMDETVTPLESGLAWTVAWEPENRDFIGREALAAQRKAGVPQRLIGLVLEDRGVIRAHQSVTAGGVEGEVTSGSFSPTLGRSIALARVPVDFPDEDVTVSIRGRALAARVVKPPFVRHGAVRV